MKNLTLLAGAALMLAVSVSSARAEKAAKAETPKEISCAVMKGDKVNIADATKKKMFADYKGNRYFFCCAGCPDAFKKDPAKFAKSEHIPTPKK
jgi:YHS domain-containing protein